MKSAVTPPRVMITDKLRSCGAARAQDGPLRRTSPAQGPEQSHGEENSHQPTRRRELIMKQFNRPGRHNGFCRFTIKSRTSSTSLIPNPSLPTSAVRRASEPLRLGARSPRRALRPSSSLRKIASSARRSPNLTIPAWPKARTAQRVPLRIGWFVNEELFRSDLAAEKSERPRDYMTVGYLSDTSGLFHSGLKLASQLPGCQHLSVSTDYGVRCLAFSFAPSFGSIAAPRNRRKAKWSRLRTSKAPNAS